MRNEGVYKASHIASYLVSNPILNFFTNKAIDLVEKGHKGSGMAYSVERRVYKWGEIYTNGKWKDYYRGHSDEVYWSQKIIIYDKDKISKVIYKKDKDYWYDDGYNPIYVENTRYFSDNDKVYKLALSQYISNGYIYGDSGKVVGYNPYGKWFKGVKLSYKDIHLQ
ncbi:hypothetical protein SAMN02745912_03877 [Paramaledivibacter caminithermalis DSM 15212]|uniref:Uncharacterized protein n=1 Tax=Paramaledivibacter caminithermalis (strain DSM 15212 / CIP 107654 / DViRD3) TaxID=1121301 RepID=A0A1M6U5K5_PARC5|nr:hypothetical protein SAMN02745912_03877 [Paramaledivibacter caminithermalis DSM 15212]